MIDNYLYYLSFTDINLMYFKFNMKILSHFIKLCTELNR